MNWQLVKLSLRCFHDAQGAHQFVCFQSGRTKPFGQFTMHHLTVESQLPTPLLRMNKTDRSPRIHGIGSVNVSDIGSISLDFNLGT